MRFEVPIPTRGSIELLISDERSLVSTVLSFKGEVPPLIPVPCAVTMSQPVITRIIKQRAEKVDTCLGRGAGINQVCG